MVTKNSLMFASGIWATIPVNLTAFPQPIIIGATLSLYRGDEAMDDLEKKREELKDRAREVATELVAPRAADIDAHGEIPSELIEVFAEEGFLSLMLRAPWWRRSPGFVVPHLSWSFAMPWEQCPLWLVEISGKRGDTTNRYRGKPS
jgi:hypothetical protein